MYKQISRLIKQYGFKKTVQYCFQRLIGIENHQSEIDSLFYFLNNCIDITTIPKAKDENLRKLQECDVVLLGIFDKICKKLDVKYWLDFGTLLGTERHKGFIPWDDDMDVAMLREDYNKFIQCAPSLLKPLGIEVSQNNTWYGLSYKHQQTGIWLDIFPYDIYNKDYSLYVPCNTSSSDDIKDCFIRLGEEIKFEKIYFNYNNIFPLRSSMFENYEFSIPNVSDSYLHSIYGDYMSFPKFGIMMHSNGDDILSMRSVRNNLSMVIIREKLEQIYESI